MTKARVNAMLPRDAYWSCSFGYPGDEHYSEYWRDPRGMRYLLEKTYDVWTFHAELH